MNDLKYRFLRWLNKTTKESLSHDHCKKFGCDSACPKCKVWESEGNTIYTEYENNDVDKRTCTNCNNVWYTIFTPAGHYPVDYTPKDVLT